MQKDTDILIVGAGHAGVAMAEALRRHGFAGTIHLVDGEPGLPVERPPLSKAWLSDTADAAKPPHGKPLLRAEDWYGENDITLITGNPVTAITPEAATLGDGKVIPFTHLVLATGADPRHLPSVESGRPDAGRPDAGRPDAGRPDAGRLFVLRSAGDASRFAAALDGAKNLVVIGGGYIGLEVAASARARDIGVTVIEAAERILARVASEPASAFFENLHREHGVEILTSARVTGVDEHDAGITVHIGDRAIKADCSLVGIGVIPATGLAESLGLDCGNGIIVDAAYRTGTDTIYAIGDVALSQGGYTAGEGYGAMRIESVHHAQMSAEIAAASIMGVTPRPAHEVPWFWSDQYDRKLQSVGIVPPECRTVTHEGRRGCSFWSFDKDGVLRAVEAVSDAASYMAGRKLVGGKTITPEMVAAEDFDPKALLRA